MLKPGPFPRDILLTRTPEETREEVKRTINSVIDRLEPGQSIKVERLDDDVMPWRFTWEHPPT